jgi:hypothetical protein
MKNCLIVLMVMAFAVSASAQGFRAPIEQKKRKVLAPPPVTNRSEVQGVIPRAFRGGNPLQMLNPKAPAKYGTSEQSIVYNAYTGQIEGIKLFEIVF